METEANEEDPLVIETFTKQAEERIVETPKKPVEKLKEQSLMIDDPMDEENSEEK